MGAESASGRRGRSASGWRRPIRWIRAQPVWVLPKHVLIYVLAVEAMAVAAAAYTATLFPVGTTDLSRFGIIAACAIAHIEVTRTIERQREVASGAGPYLDLKSVWNFAALLVLPPLLATAMVLLTYGYAWVRIWPRNRPVLCYRWVFSAATVVFASQIAAAILAFAAGQYPGIPPGLSGLAIIAVAATVRWMINYALVVGVILLSAPQTRARDAMGNLGGQVLEAGAIGLAIAAAGLLVSQPALVIGVAVALLAMHRTVLVDQYQRAARTDAKTGLYNAGWWRQLAERVLTRAEYRNTPVGVLIADLDHFKLVNDTHGHPAGDEVLRAAAQAIRDEIRQESDMVGRFGGEEFVVLLPGINPADLLAAAERIRRRMHKTVIDITTTKGPDIVSITISVGAAIYPTDGTTLDELLLAADSALYAAKEGGRDQTRLSTPVRIVENERLSPRVIGKRDG